MQKISIAINAVLLIAVGVLFYMVFSLKKQLSGESGSDGLPMVSLSLPKADGKIMFVNIDSLKAKYDYFLKIEAQLLKKGKANEAEIKNMYDVFQKSYQKYQEQGQAGTMSQQQIETAQADLAQKEKAIREREEQITQNFTKEAEKMNQQFLQYVLSYLKKKSKEHNYSYVMGYAEGSNLLYVNDSLDITKQVVNGLNADYNATPEK